MSALWEYGFLTKLSEDNPSMTKEDKNPKGGLSAKGRKKLRRAGQDIKPGVKGKADTDTKKKRKGSFLARHYCGPNKPVKKDGEPTRHALQANAWGESVPSSQGAVDSLCAKGRRLLDKINKDKKGAFVSIGDMVKEAGFFDRAKSLVQNISKAKSTAADAKELGRAGAMIAENPSMSRRNMLKEVMGAIPAVQKGQAGLKNLEMVKRRLAEIDKLTQDNRVLQSLGNRFGGK